MATTYVLTPDCFSDYSHWVEYIRQLHGCGATIVATDGKSIQHIWGNIVDSGYFPGDDD